MKHGNQRMRSEMYVYLIDVLGIIYILIYVYIIYIYINTLFLKIQKNNIFDNHRYELRVSYVFVYYVIDI